MTVSFLVGCLLPGHSLRWGRVYWVVGGLFCSVVSACWPSAAVPPVRPSATATAVITAVTLPPTAPREMVTLPTSAASTAPTSTATPTELPEVRLLFTGDINPGRCPAQVALAANDFTLPYRAVADELRSADITVASLDGSISDQSRPAQCPETNNLIGPARTVEGLQFAGIDVVVVATNHIKNCGARGWTCNDAAFRDTLQNLAAAGIVAVGGGETLAAARAPAIVERSGVRFAFLGVSAIGEEMWATADRPGVASLSEDTLAEVCQAIAAARAQAEVVIVLPHWGIEYTVVPDERQWRWAGAMLDAGATLIVGNHPHMVQAVEVLPSGLVAYALGNFIFDQGPWQTRQGAVLETVFRGPRLASWRLRPVHIYSLYQPRWTEAAETEAILSRVATASAALPPR